MTHRKQKLPSNKLWHNSNRYLYLDGGFRVVLVGFVNITLSPIFSYKKNVFKSTSTAPPPAPVLYPVLEETSAETQCIVVTQNTCLQDCQAIRPFFSSSFLLLIIPFLSDQILEFVTPISSEFLPAAGRDNIFFPFPSNTVCPRSYFINLDRSSLADSNKQQSVKCYREKLQIT